MNDPWNVYIGMWVDDLETGQAMGRGRIAQPRTVTTYRFAVERLADFLRETVHPTGVTRQHILDWLAHMRAQGLSEQSCLQRFRGVGRFFGWMIEEGEIENTPLAKIKPPVPDEKLVPVIAEGDLKKLMKVVSGTDFESRRNRAIISLFIDCGMRVSEMVGITLSDVDLDEREITLMGKGRRPRTVRFVRETRKDLQRYLLARDRHRLRDSEWLWLGPRGRVTVSGMYRMLERMCERAGIPRINPHKFRHTFAHEYLRAGGSEGDLMRVTGWKTREMVDRYGASAAVARAGEAHDRFSPRRGL